MSEQYVYVVRIEDLDGEGAYWGVFTENTPDLIFRLKNAFNKEECEAREDPTFIIEWEDHEGNNYFTSYAHSYDETDAVHKYHFATLTIERVPLNPLLTPP